jgi:hypothetical protein
VVQDVCAAVGVDRPTSVFSNINYNRTMTEMLALANEMAQRIAYDTREWTVLTRLMTLTPEAGVVDPVYNQMAFTLADDFKRMLLTTSVRKKSTPTVSMRFIPDADQWVQRRLRGFSDSYGEWVLSSYKGMTVSPPLSDLRTSLTAWANSTVYAVGTKVRDGTSTFWSCKTLHTSAATGTFAADRAARPTFWTQIFQDQILFPYLSKNCIGLPAAGAGDAFLNDSDTFFPDERLLKLGMIWQWKANKGSPYAEDLGTYNDALNRVAGADKPAPIIVGRLPISSAARVGYPFPIDPGMVPL